MTYGVVGRDESIAGGAAADRRPILIVPYMWIGDFVRCHSVVQVLQSRFPQRPVDVLATPLTAPLADYMPGVRQAVLSDLPRRRLALRRQWRLAARLAAERYGSALVMPRTWKAALAPWLAGIPERIGHLGEARFVLLNDVRRNEKRLPRMVDRCAALALPKHASVPAAWPPPRLAIPPAEVTAWRARRGLDERRPIVALAPGAVGAAKRWPASSYAELAAALARQGLAVWIMGGPGEKALASRIVEREASARDLTGDDLRDAALASAAADAVVSNDSGLLHVAAAIGTPSIGLFGPTSPWHWAPLNPLAATIEAERPPPCRPCHKPDCRVGHHSCMRDIPVDRVLRAVTQALGRAPLALAR